MDKLVKFISTIVLALILFASNVSALPDKVAISDLLEFTRSDNFYLSYSSLSDNPVTAQFYVMKEGGSYSAFGAPVSGYNGQIQVTGSQIGEQVKYYFKVVINGGTASDETSIFYDASGPSPVQNYWKEMVAPGYYKLHWKNPGDSDFSRVFIYRSESTDFEANGTTRVGELGGSPDEEMTWDNSGLDTNKTYYYALRAVDNAGNPSSIVADPEVGATTVEGTIVTDSTSTGGVTTLPSEEGRGGQVLGDEEEDGLDTDSEDADSLESLLQGLGDNDEDAEPSPTRRFLTSFFTAFVVYMVYRRFFRKKRN